MTGAERIAIERQRQIDQEGWTPERDDAYTDAELVRAAICYAQHGSGFDFGSTVDHHYLWPWDQSWWKADPENRIRSLEKAGALIAAEIDRLQRSA